MMKYPLEYTFYIKPLYVTVCYTSDCQLELMYS
jgi:hypothetical protein